MFCIILIAWMPHAPIHMSDTYTSCHLYERCDEEHLNMKTSKQSEIKDHIKQCNACGSRTLSFRDFCIVRRCKSETHAKLFEAFAIKRMRPTLNKQLFAHGASKILHIWKWGVVLCIVKLVSISLFDSNWTFFFSRCFFLFFLSYLEKE